MYTPYVGQIQPFAFDFAPKNWVQCNGQIMQVTTNQALFSLLGTVYGGDGRTTFQLPDLRCRFPVHYGAMNSGPVYNLGQNGGSAAATLTVAQLPQHSHILSGNVQVSLNVGPAATTQNANTGTPANGASLAVAGSNAGGTFTGYDTYLSVTPNVTLSGSGAVNTLQLTGTASTAGASSPVPTVPPYLGVNYCIALTGLYPSRN